MAGVDKIGVGIFAVTSAGTAALGVWQLQRRQDKIAQIAARRAKLASSQASLSPDSEPPMFSRITIPPGTKYTGSEQFLVGPRAGPISITGHGKGTGLSAGGLGYYVISPFALPNGRTLLVNRGWCRRDGVGPALESIHSDDVEGSAAIIRPSEYSSAPVTPLVGV